jgi:hypothetical protein
VPKKIKISTQSPIITPINILIFTKKKPTMNKTIFYIAGILIFLTTACVQSPDFYTYDYPEFALDQGPHNSNVDDNVIFQGGRVFTYSCQVFDSLGVEEKIITTYNFNKYNPVDWKRKKLPLEDVLVSEYPIDSIRLKVFNNTGNSTQADQQTMIVYEYFNEKGTIVPETERTGLVEDSTAIALNPPRNSGFALLQFSPYPEIEFPLSVGKSWNSSQTIPIEWAVLLKMEFENPVNVYSTFTVKARTTIETPLGSQTVWVIEGIGENRFRDTQTTLYFNKEIGFVKMEFENVDGSRIGMSLERVQ